MKKLYVFLSLLLISSLSYAETIDWTVNYISGINTTASGTTYALIATDHTPYNPSTTGMVWQACSQNRLYMHKDANGNPIPTKTFDRMLTTLLVGYSKKSRIRLGIERDSNNNCYLRQSYIFS